MVDTAAPAVPQMPAGGAQSASQILAERRAGSRDSALAALAQIRSGGSPAVPAAPPAPAAGAPDPVSAVAPTETAAPADPEVPADVPTETPVAEPPPAPPPAPEAEPPGMALLRKQEQHMRRQLAEERQKLQTEIETARRENQAALERAQAVTRRIEALRHDPAAVIELLSEAGYGEADFDPLARFVYSHSTEGKKKGAPNTSEVHRTAAQRAQQTALEKLQNEFTEFRKSVQAERQQAEQRSHLERYAASVAKAATDDTPLAKAALAKAPERTQQKLLDVAARLYYQSGPSDDLRDEPTPAEVLKAYEAGVALELEELGIDVKALRRSATPVTPPPAPAPTPPATRPAATLAPSGGAAPTPTRAPDAKPDRDEVLKALQRLRNTGSL